MDLHVCPHSKTLCPCFNLSFHSCHILLYENFFAHPSGSIIFKLVCFKQLSNVKCDLFCSFYTPFYSLVRGGCLERKKWRSGRWGFFYLGFFLFVLIRNSEQIFAGRLYTTWKIKTSQILRKCNLTNRWEVSFHGLLRLLCYFVNIYLTTGRKSLFPKVLTIALFN